MSNTTTHTSPRGGAVHPGPPLGAPAIVFVATFVASILAAPLAGGGTMPSPFGPSALVQIFFAANSTTTAVGALLMLLSATALLVFSAVGASRLQYLAPNAPGPLIAGFGGVAAAVALAASACASWVLSMSPVSQDLELVHAIHGLAFVLGGPAHVVSLGVLVLGLAVTTIFVNRTPRVLSKVGIVIAAVDFLSVLALLSPSAAHLVPLGRFASLFWLVVMAVQIPRARGARRQS